MGSSLKKTPAAIQHIYTLLLVVVGWVFFASSDMDFAFSYLRVMFFAGGAPLVDSNWVYYLLTNLILIIICIVCSTPLLIRLFNKLLDSARGWAFNLAVALEIIVLLLSVAFIVTESYNPFLYLRF